MRNKISTTSTDRSDEVRLVGAEWATFAAVCLLLGTVLTLLATPASADEPAPADEAVSQEAAPAIEPPIAELRELIGKPAEVTFTVMSVGGKSNLYLNSDKNWRSPDSFTLMLVPAARDELKKLGTDEPFDDLIGRRVLCRGELELDRDRVRIVVRDFAKQFELIAPEAEADDADTGNAQAAMTGEETPAAATPAAASSTPPTPDGPYIHPSIEELRTLVGQECDVTFRVMNAGGRTHLYINSQQDFRRPDCFTAQIEPAALSGLNTLGLDNPKTALIGKLLKCHGTVVLNNNRLSIVVTDANKQLQVVEEPAQKSAEEPKPVTETPAAP